MLSKNYSFEKALEMLAYIIGESKESTFELIKECINVWLKKDLIIKINY